MLANKSPARAATPPVTRGTAKVKGRAPPLPTSTARHGNKKDIRADKPCHFVAAGTRTLGCRVAW
eukprot:12208506-Heterocapsa_arctica.AAC.1